MQEKEQIKFEILRNRISAERERISATAEVKRTGDKMMKSLNGEERTVLPEYQELAEINPDLLAGFLLMELILIIQSCRHFGNRNTIFIEILRENILMQEYPLLAQVI